MYIDRGQQDEKKISKKGKLTYVKSLIKVYNCSMAEKYKDIERQLKQALIESPMRNSEIAMLSGLSEAQLSYFVNDKRSLSLPAAAKLARVLELELKTIRKGGVK
ncbi:helix-turn-helix domain-containing protein [Planctomycetota bacterium]